MKTTKRWLNATIFFFLLLCPLRAFAPIGDPGMCSFERPKIDLQLPPVREVLSDDAVLQYANELNFFDPELLLAVAKIESRLQPKATSLYKGIKYYGMMQMSYNTAKMLGFKGHPSDLMNWKTNVKLAAIYLEKLYNEHGTTSNAVAAYNAGTVIHCRKCEDKSKVVNQKYVDKVMKTYQEIQETKWIKVPLPDLSFLPKEVSCAPNSTRSVMYSSTPVYTPLRSFALASS